MDLFNKKLVKLLKEENERLMRLVAQPMPITVHKGNVEQFISRVRIERDVPIDIVKEHLARRIVDELIEHKLIDYDVEYDALTMTNYITARIFVGKKG